MEQIDYPHLRNSETFERIRQTLKNKCLFSVRCELDFILSDIDLKIEQLSDQRQLLIEIIDCTQKADRFNELRNNYYVTDRTLRERKKRNRAKQKLIEGSIDNETPRIVKGGAK